MTPSADLRAEFERLRVRHEEAGQVVARHCFRVFFERGDPFVTPALDAALFGGVLGLRQLATETLRRHDILCDEFVEFYVDVAERAFRTEFARLICAWQGEGGRA